MDFKEYRQLRPLTNLKQGLPKRWKARLDALKSKHGEVEHPDMLNWFSGVMSGPTSPISQSQIEEMSLKRLVSYLQEWQQPTEFTMESPEGISRTLSSVVAKNPERFAHSVFVFTDVDPTYVRGILSGFREALKTGNNFSWKPVLKFMKWVVQQDSVRVNRITSRRDDIDPNWGWTRAEISRLLEDALNNEKSPIDHDNHNLVWDIIEPITQDPEPSSTDEEKSSWDYATNSLNTTRGVAFHTLIVYALWRKRSLLKKDKDQEIGFGEMPEVRKVLDEHLRAQKPLLTIMAVYGWRFVNLLYLDRNWALANKNRIFPQSENERSYWDAAWNSFIAA